jgi:glycosyltransferase involved in cell wall biosynthesis
MRLVPELSVIIPVRNGGLFLAEAIESVVNQQVEFEFEILIIDDGSTDNTVEIVRDYVNTFPFVRLIHNERNGVGSALQTGLINSLGAVIVRLDSDDRMLPGRLQTHFASFGENRDLAVQGSQVAFIGNLNPGYLPNSYPKKDIEIRAFLAIGNAFADPSVAFSRDKAIAVGGFRNTLNGAEQYDLWMRLSLVGSLENLEDVFTEYRIHINQFTRTRNNRVYFSTILVQLMWFLGLTQLRTRISINRSSEKIRRSSVPRISIPFFISRYILHIIVKRLKHEF